MHFLIQLQDLSCEALLFTMFLRMFLFFENTHLIFFGCKMNIFFKKTPVFTHDSEFIGAFLYFTVTKGTEMMQHKIYFRLIYHCFYLNIIKIQYVSIKL